MLESNNRDDIVSVFLYFVRLATPVSLILRLYITRAN